MERLRWNSSCRVCLLFALAWAACDTGGPNDEIQVSIRDIIPGQGTLAEKNKIVIVDYVGMLASTGDVFDSSRREDREPLSFQLETGLVENDPQGRKVIDGFTRGIPGMRVGGLRRITVPPQLAWGSRGAGCDNPDEQSGCTIPPNATLIFDIELIGVRDPEP